MCFETGSTPRAELLITDFINRNVWRNVRAGFGLVKPTRSTLRLVSFAGRTLGGSTRPAAGRDGGSVGLSEAAPSLRGTAQFALRA
jgi:hypothetical protein